MNDSARAIAVPSIPSLIAWVSVCLLAAAWGRGLDERWRPVWADTGAAGLAAAVGLDRVRTRKAASQRRAHDAELRARMEGGLDRFNQHSAAIDSIQAAVSRVSQYAIQMRRRERGDAAFAERQSPAELLAGLPIEITAADETTALDSESSLKTTGRLQSLTSRTVCFEHPGPMDARVAVLTFDLADAGRLSFVVDVHWTQKTDAQYSTGGSVLAVGVPQDCGSPRGVAC